MVKLPTGRHTQAIKSARKNREKYEKNKALRSRTRSVAGKLTQMVKDGDIEGAEKFLPEAFKLIDMAASDGAFHKNRGSRLKSRLAGKVNSLKKS